MLHSLETIAMRRRTLGLTQTQLANLAGVSQSYIAKLEANKLEPSYTKVMAIIEALSRLEQGRETKAGEIMTKEIISVQRDDPVERAVKLFWAHGFSQLPVLDRDRPIGSVTERTIIDKMVNSDGEGPISDRSVSEIMEDPFPHVGEEAPVSLIASMLRIYPAVLVHKKGEIVGIITKADLLKPLT
ncbi:MAG: CBS domain-containing protein [Candidatus Bathyarchaeota archaeon]|jgi:predicted transcriptional regulator|nr:CBS domain-containing protein [Candidatus Bathyarchaeota archaeon]